ncbi:MAG: hypothetical protein WC819_01805 [Parcubacteria group bacterium]|jgi:2'-5' RNA ligase
MQQKLFIGIDLDTHFKRAISRAIRPWQELPIKWHKEDSFHVGLITIGWVSDSDFLQIENALLELSAKTPSFSLSFTKVVARSKDINKTDPRDAQRVQVIGEDSEMLKELYYAIGKALHLPLGKNVSFRPVIALGSMRAQKWQELTEYPPMEMPLPFEMDVSALTLFESTHVDDTWQFEPVCVFDLR